MGNTTRHEGQNDVVHNVMRGRLLEADRSRRVDHSSLLRTLKEKDHQSTSEQSHRRGNQWQHMDGREWSGDQGEGTYVRGEEAIGGRAGGSGGGELTQRGRSSSGTSLAGEKGK